MGTLADEPDSLPPVGREQLVLFGARMRQLREKVGLTQAELAQQSGIDRVAISQIERGQRDVGVVRAAAVARALGVHPGELFPSG